MPGCGVTGSTPTRPSPQEDLETTVVVVYGSCALMEILLPALFAGAVAIGVTVAVERLGGLKGGLIGTLPTTIVPAALGMFAQVDLPGFQLAMYAVPAGMFMNALFLGVWSALPGRLPAWPSAARLSVTLLASLLLWGVLATTLVVGFRDHVTLTAGIVVTIALGFLGLIFTARTPAAPRGHNRVGVVVLISRGLAAALAIGVAMMLATRGDEVAAGIAAVFPAIFLTTMVALWIAQGEAVPAGAAGPMMVGSTSVATFALLATWSMASFGSIAGTLVAWAIAAGAQLPLFFLTRAVLGRWRNRPARD